MNINEKIEFLEKMGYKFEIHKVVKYAINVTSPSGKENILNFGTALKRNIRFADSVDVSEKELFGYFFPLDEEEMCVFKNGYSIRTKNYMDTVKKNIGFMGTETLDDYSGTFADEDLVKTDYFHKETYSEIDNFGEIRYYFNHYPSQKEIQTAIMLGEAKTNFRIGKWKEEFRCWECGRRVHFLDIKGDFLEKVRCMEDRYCGC